MQKYGANERYKYKVALAGSIDMYGRRAGESLCPNMEAPSARRHEQEPQKYTIGVRWRISLRSAILYSKRLPFLLKQEPYLTLRIELKEHLNDRETPTST